MEMLEGAIQTIISSGNYKLLRRLDVDNHPALCTAAPTQPLKTGLSLDTETTGFSHGHDKIIELGMISFSFDPGTMRIHNILDRFNGFEDPGVPLSQDVINVTGINDAMLAGQRLDDDRVNSMLTTADIIFCHNAKFDRPFMEDRFPVCVQKQWACTLSQIDWSGEYITSRTLEYLLFKLGGWFIDAHRALNDAEGLLGLLLEDLPHAGTNVLRPLVEKALSNDTLIHAVGSPFDKKDILKERGYRWNDGSNGKPKSWWTEVEGDGTAELEWLAANIYPNGNISSVRTTPVDAYSRFSIR